MSETGWMRFFGLAALWNLGAAAVGILASRFAFELLFGDEAYTGDYHQLWLFRTFWAVVALFGIAYAIIALHPDENRGMVWLGIVGKLLVFAFVVHAVLSDAATTAWLLIATGDLLWAVLFAEFLRRTRTRVRVGNLFG